MYMYIYIYIYIVHKHTYIACINYEIAGQTVFLTWLQQMPDVPGGAAPRPVDLYIT